MSATPSSSPLPNTVIFEQYGLQDASFLYVTVFPCLTSSESHIEAQLTFFLAFSAAPLVRVIVDPLPWHARRTSNYCISMPSFLESFGTGPYMGF